MSNNIFLINITDSIKSKMSNFANERIESVKKGHPVENVNEKIEKILKEGFTEIEKYCAQNSVTKKDLDFIIIFRDNLIRNDLTKIDKSISDISLKIINGTIEKIDISDIENFKTKANFKEKIEFLFIKLKEIFIFKIKDSINNQVFYTWDQKLKYNYIVKKN